MSSRQRHYLILVISLSLVSLIASEPHVEFSRYMPVRGQASENGRLRVANSFARPNADLPRTFEQVLDQITSVNSVSSLSAHNQALAGKYVQLASNTSINGTRSFGAHPKLLPASYLSNNLGKGYSPPTLSSTFNPLAQNQMDKQQTSANGIEAISLINQKLKLNSAARLLGPINRPQYISNLTSDSNSHRQESDSIQTHQNVKRVDLLDKICMGTSNLMAPQHNTTDHYQNLVDRYSNCTYVTGNLEITWLERGASEKSVDMSFLESIREITGYLLIAHVDVDHIKMPNLQIIRGRDMFSYGDQNFSMILIENKIKTLVLPNLREILQGSVGSYNSSKLGYLHTINWDEILNTPYRSVFVYNDVPEVAICDQSCFLGSCWADGPEMCQKYSKVHNCPKGCQRCSPSGHCCHSYCAGGCTGPKATDCLACKNFYDDGECIHECPSMERYNPSKFSWEPNPNGKFAFGATCVKQCPEHLLKDNGACVRICPPRKHSVNGECIPCPGPCPKNCQGVEVVHSGNIDQMINCTIIEGSITILDRSFTGYSEIQSNGSQIVYEPMHPSRLEAFKTLKEITGSLFIQGSHHNFTDLSYFRNLRTIGGRQTNDMFYALSITKTSLVSLNLRALRKVKSGRILIEDNQDLCFADTIDWMQLNITRREDITTRNNAEQEVCDRRGLRCHEQCAKDGCWGPGPDECLSCKDYKLDDYCVHNCNSLETLGLLSFESNRTSRICTRCDPECKGGCSGTTSQDCHECKNVKDGPYCKPSCPIHKYNNDGVCDECDESCFGSCTGTSNRLGQGGCNSCGKTVINHTEPTISAYCIRATDACPEGFYQDYVGSHLDGPFKGPVCRKCHQRCKSCKGIGTHTSVCECARYVAGEQCEDYCPRDYYPDEQSRHCKKCSSECNGCTGPTEADCISCRVYRIYDQSGQYNSNWPESGPELARQSVKFNCTAHCPPEKPYRISESNLLDPYCSEFPGSETETSRQHDSTSLIFIILVLITTLICFAKFYKCQKEKDKKLKLTMHLSGLDDIEPLSPSNLKPNLAPLRSIKDTELRKGEVLGSGFGGTVYKGLWFPEGQEHREPRPVAIKVLRDNGQSNMNKEFLDEAYIMASVNHPNLVRLLAVCMTPKHLMLVTQLMPLGCLLDYVKKHRNIIGSKNLLEWSKQIAKGMSYLEENRMVHRDLALRNILLHTSGRALVSDFGLAKFLEVDQSEYHAGGGRLPIKWLAPECIRERKFTHKSDVWAFGVTVWELVSFGARPFEEYETKDVPTAIEKGARLQQPNYVSAEVYKVMYACWFYNPEDRPNFKGLAQNFVNFARDPERYLICGTRGIEYSLRQSVHMSSESDDNAGEYESEEESLTDEGSQPMSALQPDLTPSTHNRINQMFGFELQHPHHHADIDSIQSPREKKFTFLENESQGTDETSVNCGLNRTSEPQSARSDLNNNFLPSNRLNATVNSCWSMHHSISTDSLSRTCNNELDQTYCVKSGFDDDAATSTGQKSDQPTDIYDYLLPSPVTEGLQNRFSTIYQDSQGPKSATIDRKMSRNVIVRSPPHSAGVVSVNNEEYFLTRLSYVNQALMKGETNASQHQMSTSNGNIPHSLV